MNPALNCRKPRVHHLALLCVVCISLFFGAAAPAQKDKKKKKDNPASDTTPSTTAPRLTDEQSIDRNISEMLAAWQINDAERLHQYYADDVSVVSGNWTPPVTGWTNFLASYQALAARMRQVRKDRQNTLVRIHGDMAWASFQWEFSALVDGQPIAARGQTTLIFEKRNDRWLIVHDHSSVVQTAQSPQPGSTPARSTPPQ